MSYIHPYVVVHLKSLKRQIFRNGGSSKLTVTPKNYDNHGLLIQVSPLTLAEWKVVLYLSFPVSVFSTLSCHVVQISGEPSLSILKHGKDTWEFCPYIKFVYTVASYVRLHMYLNFSLAVR